MEKQVKSGGIHPAKPMEDKKKTKEEKLKELKELSMLFKPVQTQKVEKGNFLIWQTYVNRFINRLCL